MLFSEPPDASLCSSFVLPPPPASFSDGVGSPVAQAALNQAPDLPASSWGEDLQTLLVSSSLSTMRLGKMNCPYGGDWGN